MQPRWLWTVLAWADSLSQGFPGDEIKIKLFSLGGVVRTSQSVSQSEAPPPNSDSKCDGSLSVRSGGGLGGKGTALPPTHFIRVASEPGN